MTLKRRFRVSFAHAQEGRGQSENEPGPGAAPVWTGGVIAPYNKGGLLESFY